MCQGKQHKLIIYPHPLQLLQIGRRGVPPFLQISGWGISLELGLGPAAELITHGHHAAAAAVHADVLGADVVATEGAAQRLVGAEVGAACLIRFAPKCVHMRN